MNRSDHNFPVPVAVHEEGGVPPVQTPEQRKVEALLLQLADSLGAPLGMDRRRFLQTSCGMAAAFMAMNSVFGPLFRVDAAEAADPAAAAEGKRKFSDQIIFDVQTHYVSDRYSSPMILGLRQQAKKWNPKMKEGIPKLDDIRFENFLREVFLESDTRLALLSSAPADNPKKWFLKNGDLKHARDLVTSVAGSKRLFCHALFTPGRPGWHEEMDRAAEWKPDSWKGYTVGEPFGKSKWPWRLDDEKLVYPVYEKMVKAGITTVCIHKGLLPPAYKVAMRDTWKYGLIDDLPKAAKDWPQLTFVIYHSAIKSGGPAKQEDVEHFEKTGYIPWISDLARIPQEHGVKNVYAELGSVFGVNAISNPRYCAAILGTLIKGMGSDHVIWGTDSVWYGSPQWQIEAMRRIEVPEDLQKKFGFQPLGEADGKTRNAIFAGNSLKMYGVKKETVAQEDAFTRLKGTFTHS